MGDFVEKKTVIMKQKISYKDAGVDIEKADQAIDSSKKVIKETFSGDVLSSIGGFGSMYSLKNLLKDYDEPIMVQSIDGVGTKMSVAQRCGDFRFIGTDLVSACCNDVAATGARPLTFLDYIASDSLNPKTVSEIIKSVAVECKKLGVSLVGGETAEMPGTYRKTEYDLVGVATGIIDKKNIIDGSKIKNGDAVLGLPSSGLHTNGYSLARKLMFDTLKMKVNDVLPGHTATVKDVLLAPHKNYSMVINDLITKDSKGDLQDIIAFRADKNQIIYVKPEDTLSTAFNRMNNSDISQLPILEEEKLIGMITENDILHHCTNNKGFEKKVSECMQENYVSLQINSSLDDLIELLKENNIAIILNDKKFVGIITRIDLLAYLKRN